MFRIDRQIDMQIRAGDFRRNLQDRQAIPIVVVMNKEVRLYKKLLANDG